MAGLEGSINNILKQVQSHHSTEKGSYGEQAVFAICEEFYQQQGGILIHSYSYKVDPNLPGNIKYHNGLYIENLGTSTEIDVLYVSKYRVFPIEVKTYKAKQITLTDDRIAGCAVTDKSPVHQNEMHARHLYSTIFRGLQKGDPNFIVPIVCFVDKVDRVVDNRSDWQKNYIKLSVLNTIKDLIAQCNQPLGYQLNLTLMEKLLRESMMSNEKFLSARY